MDMMEQNVRAKEGRANFSFDACLDAVSMNFLISGPEGQQWQGERFYTYDMYKEGEHGHSVKKKV